MRLGAVGEGVWGRGVVCRGGWSGGRGGWGGDRGGWVGVGEGVEGKGRGGAE